MPKILFIEPKAPNLHIFSKYPIPRLGGALLGTMARQRGWEAEVIFEEISSLSLRNLPPADVVGISSITSTATRSYELADAYRASGIPVLMGGPHITFMPDEAMMHSDYIVRGEGEVPFASFMEAFENNSGWNSIPNLSYWHGSEIIHNSVSQSAAQLSHLPFPDLSLIRSFDRPLTKRLIPVETSRGCPYNCEFCSVNRIFGRRMRFRPIEETIKELKKYACSKNPIFFVDDNFTASPKRTKLLLEEIVRQNIRIMWTAQVRSDSARDKEMLALMQRSGCVAVYTGIETINPETLQKMKKKQNVEDVSAAVREFHNHNIRVHGMFILGFDEDDCSVAKRTVNYAKSINLNTAQFLILTPLPGTPMYDTLRNENRLLTNEWSYYDAHHVVYKPKSLLPFELQKMQMAAHRKFYSLSQQIKRLFRKEFVELAVAVYASGINRQWKELNGRFLHWLKKISKKIPLIKNGSKK